MAIVQTGTYLQNDSSGKYTLVFDISGVSQNKYQNTTYVNFALRLRCNDSSLTSSSAGDTFHVDLNGVPWANELHSWSLSGLQTQTILHQENVPIVHEKNGTKTANLYFDMWHSKGPTPPGSIQSSTGSNGGPRKVVLSAIDRRTKFTVNKTSVQIGQPVRLTLDRCDSDFTATITYTFGGQTGTIATGVTASTYDWTPNTSLCSRIPNATSGTCRITVTTKYGNTTIGSEVKDITLTVPAGNPTATITQSDVMTGKPSTMSGLFIQNKSKVRLTVTGAGQYGAGIKSITCSGAGQAAKTKTFTAAPYTFNADFAPIDSSVSVRFTITVTDTRNRTSTFTKEVPFVAYKVPSILSFGASRVDGQGSPSEEGEGLLIGYGYEIASISNKNTVSVSIFRHDQAEALKRITSGYKLTSQNYLSIDEHPYSVDESYTLTMTVSDAFTTIQRTCVVPPSFSIWEAGPSGKSFAVGMKSSDRGHFEIGERMELITHHASAFRLKQGDYAHIIRQDGNALWFLLTNQGDLDGNWNGLHPLKILNSTGAVTVGTSLTLTEGAELTDKNGTTVRGRPSLWLNSTDLTVGNFLQALFQNYQKCVRNQVHFHIKVPAGWSPTGYATWGSGFFNFQNHPGTTEMVCGGGFFVNMTGVPFSFSISQGSQASPYNNAKITWYGITTSAGVEKG